jgi:hypothetical protein
MIWIHTKDCSLWGFWGGGGRGGGEIALIRPDFKLKKKKRKKKEKRKIPYFYNRFKQVAKILKRFLNFSKGPNLAMDQIFSTLVVVTILPPF